MSVAADNIISIRCEPDSCRNLLQYSVLRIRVQVRQRQCQGGIPFRVVIRTNLNQSHRIRRQIIDHVEKGQSYSTDFYDIPAQYNHAQDEYFVDILLSEVGYFEFKVRVESIRRHQPWVKWADGENVGISVTPLEYARNNSIYCAFIRQFGQDKDRISLRDEQLEAEIQELEQRGAYVMPPGGNFAQFMEALPFIVEELGMKIIHLLPINPVPTGYGRMGMYGSPYATTDCFGIDHTYGTFSQFKTIEDQFVDLTSTIHGLGAKVFLDMVINHTGWASSILFRHRKWIKVGQDKQIISPGAWGVTWGDLVELDYRHKDLWEYMANVFLVWCRRGIDGYRLDAGYMVPLEVWQYIIARVREEFPNTLFLLEGLGGPWETTEKLLTDGQINWAYSELFQNYSQGQIKDYLGYAQGVSAGKGVLVHYAETHDNDRLAKKGKEYTLSRLYLCAFTSFSGAWGFANGVEWLATEKIDVHRNSGLSWGAEKNLVDEISQINRILADNPAFWATDNLEFIETGTERVLGFIRADEVKSNIIFCLINLNPEGSEGVSWDISQNRLAGHLGSDVVLHNLLSDEVEERSIEEGNQVELQPGQCLLYRLEKVGQPAEPGVPAICRFEYEKIALIYKILLSRFKPYEVGRIDQEKLLREVNDYRKFIVLVNTVSLEYLVHHDLADMLSGVEDDVIDHYSAVWTFRESSKEFIISGDKWLIAHTFVPCTAYLKTSEGTLRMESILGPDGVGCLSCFPPQAENQSSLLTFNWKIERNKKIIRQWQDDEYPVLSVPSGQKEPRLRKIYPIRLEKAQLRENYPTVLLTNGRGGLCQCPARPGIVNSKYDALLAVTPDAERPAHRVALVKTLKETIQVGQKFFDLDESFLNTFTRFPQPVWEFVYDDGEYYIVMERSLMMPYGHNTVFVRYKLREANTTVTLTSKCCLEFRNIHDRVKVAQDENLQNRMVQSCRATTSSDGVVFTPQKGISVQITARNGEYIEQPHWVYDLYFPEDAERQIEARGDAFAPGVFNFELRKRDNAVLTVTAKLTEKACGNKEKAKDEVEDTTQLVRSSNAAMVAENQRVKDLLRQVPAEAAQKDSFVKMLVCAMDQFLVRFDDRWLLWGGYPWISLQVREMLHCVGGLLAAGREDVARDVILLSASTVSEGLLLDWLDGTSTERTSTEASLRLFLSAYNYTDQTKETSFWDRGVVAHAGLSGADTSGPERSLREVLVDIYEYFRDGKDSKAVESGDKPRLDHKSGLLYSPAGFSWMNTSHPCATPRGGYPIEVQALWYQALGVLAEVYPPYRSEAEQLRERIAEKFMDWYWSDKREYLADVLIADRNTPAGKAPADSSLRFNQLAPINANLVPLEEARQIVDIISRRLLIPGGVRSLSEEPLATPLKIVDERGVLLADPRMPYRGVCVGGETSRRIAYHNGTAWPSAYPSFIEARASVFRFTDLAVKQALAFFEPIKTHLTEGGIGTISEMKDGNYPHRPRGCYAYALGVAEALRVYMLLKYRNGVHRYSQCETIPAATAEDK